MQNKTKLKYISQTVLKRLLIYLAVSFLGYGVLASEITSIRNDVYGIGNYINTRAVTGMLIALNIIFLFIYILFLFFTKKHLYTVENIKSGKYPITTPLYAVTYEGNDNENVEKLLDWVLSEEGQYIIEKTGYAGIK